MKGTRRSIDQAPTETLGSMITSYVEQKKVGDDIKKVVDDYNKRIKTEMLSGKLTEFIVGNIKATCTETAREDFNEEQAIEILRKTMPRAKFGSIVKTREYLDSDALEKAVFNKELDAAVLSPCRVQKEPTITLRIATKK